jgi:hypothetical protein
MLSFLLSIQSHGFLHIINFKECINQELWISLQDLPMKLTMPRLNLKYYTVKNCLIFGKVKHLFPLYNLSLVKHMWLSFYHLLYIRFCQFPWLSQWWINLCLLNQRQTDKGNHQVSLLFYLDLSMFQSGTASS